MCRLIIIIFLVIPMVSVCQQNKKTVEKMSFQMISSIGIIGGESGVKPGFQLIGGISRSGYFAGIGLGYENYRYKSLPLFADLRINFTKKQFGFAYGDLGYTIPVGKNPDGDFFKTTNLYYGGIYFDVGLGYRHRFNNKNSFLFSLGYTRKDINNKAGYTYPCFNPPCPESISYYKYSMERVVTKLSWEFGRGSDFKTTNGR
jgi:hypothetical protein